MVEALLHHGLAVTDDPVPLPLPGYHQCWSSWHHHPWQRCNNKPMSGRETACPPPVASHRHPCSPPDSQAGQSGVPSFPRYAHGVIVSGSAVRPMGQGGWWWAQALFPIPSPTPAPPPQLPAFRIYAGSWRLATGRWRMEYASRGGTLPGALWTSGSTMCGR